MLGEGIWCCWNYMFSHSFLFLFPTPTLSRSLSHLMGLFFPPHMCTFTPHLLFVCMHTLRSHLPILSLSPISLPISQLLETHSLLFSCNGSYVFAFRVTLPWIVRRTSLLRLGTLTFSSSLWLTYPIIPSFLTETSLRWQLPLLVLKLPHWMWKVHITPSPWSPITSDISSFNLRAIFTLITMFPSVSHWLLVSKVKLLMPPLISGITSKSSQQSSGLMISMFSTSPDWVAFFLALVMASNILMVTILHLSSQWYLH